MNALRKVLMVFLAVGFISLYPAMSYADNDHRGDRDGRHGDNRRHDHDRHRGGSAWHRDWHRDWRHDHHSFFNVDFRFAPAPRRYFYERTVFVEPPVVTYYTPPVTVVQQPPAPILTAPLEADNMNEFTVNIPNGNGTFTSVLIKRSGNGFVGPQGEFYYEFPPVAQLRVVYGV